MSLVDHYPPHASAPTIDRNTIKWSGYFATTEQAQTNLEDKIKRIVDQESKLVVSAKKEFINRHFKGYFLFRFTVILANKP